MPPKTTCGSALEFFLDYYRHHALDHTVLYPGVAESLDRMHRAGLQLAVLTNKPVRTSRRILDGLGVGVFFFQVYGGNSFEHKKPHRIGVDTLRAEAGALRRDTWMVGDSYVDVQTARNAGVASCGVTWGFQPESFREFPPDILVDRLEDFADRFIAPMNCLFCEIAAGRVPAEIVWRGDEARGLSRSPSAVPRPCAADSGNSTWNAGRSSRRTHGTFLSDRAETGARRRIGDGGGGHIHRGE